MNTQLKYLLAAVVLVAVLFGGYLLLHSGGGRGGTSNADAIVLDSSLTTGTYLQVGSFFNLGAGCTRNGDNGCPTITLGQDAGITEVASTGSCNTATSTWFVAVNPFAAVGTSTATLTQMYGPAQATSTNLKIGTTTSSRLTGLASTEVSGVLANATIPTSTPPWYLSAGLTVAVPLSAGSGSATTVVVGPNENVTAYATTTFSGAGAANYVQAPCTNYKVRWRR